MRKIVATILLSMMVVGKTAAIGEWNAYLAYHDITDIEPAGRLVYVLSSNDLFSYNVSDKSVYAYNKTNTLSDTEISNIAWNQTVKKLLIVYSNFNIDLLDNNYNVENISDYYSKAMIGDKTVYNVTINGNYAYMATGFGIIKLNMRDAEISETYNLGRKVTDVAVSGTSIIAQTPDGNYKGNTAENLIDPHNWTLTTESISFADTNDITVSNSQGYTEYIVYDATNKCYWSNQQDGTLQSWTENDGQRIVQLTGINADGPRYNYFGFMKYTQGGLYTCNGGDWENANPVSIHQFRDNTWTFYPNDGIKEKTGINYRSAMGLDVDPYDPNHVMVGSGSGLYEYRNGKFINFYNSDNSPITSAFDPINKDYELVTGLKYDTNGNLWLLLTLAYEQCLLELKKNGEWVTHQKSEFMTYSKGRSAGFLRNVILGSKNMLWIANDFYSDVAFFCYDITNDKVTRYADFTNQNGTDMNAMAVSSVAEDKEGNIWIGTNVGPAYLKASLVGTDDKSITQYIVSRNDGTNLGDYLLSGVNITSIAIDAANRKWFGTRGNGVYLISADNNTQLQHFLSSNSGLLSDDVESIAINSETGEVFFGTSKGLCSYMSDATKTNDEMTKDNVWAYPNPVKPDYTGLITITGLTYNADVKICTSNGVLVNEGRSSGGTYTWDGRDQNGDRVASGVYMVQTATSDGSKGTVCKIAIIR